MKKLFLLTLILSACNLVCAQKIYDVSEFHIKKKNAGSFSASHQGGSYFVLSINSEGKGEYTYVYNNGLTTDHYSEDDIEYVYIKNRKYKDVSDEERAALMDFYNATDGPHWLHNEGWGEDCLVAYWYGVSATRMLSSSDSESHVTHIDLTNNNLSGTIPPSIKALSSLKVLELSTNSSMPGVPNNLTGTLPEEMSSLTELKSLDVAYNNLCGEFPEHPFSELMNQLKSYGFIFFGNNFALPLPEWVKNHDRFWEFYPDFCSQKSYIDSDSGWDDYFKNLYIPGSKYILTDMDGNIHKHTEDYSDNKLTIIYKYASWCPFSKALTPKIVKAYNRYKDVGLKVLGLVNLLGDDDIVRYIADNGITWPNVPMEGASGSGKYLDWDDEGTNYYFPMEFSGVPALDAVNQQGELILPWIKNYNDIIPIIEQMFGPVEADYYTSTDYSRDGEVIKLQSATEGKGIDIVFLGDAFVDKDMAPNGKYEQKMREAMEQFFSEEPYTTMRNRFNVYAVKVVSPNAEFATDAMHALNEDNEKAFEYAKKAVGENADRMMVGVLYNTDYYVERSYCTMYSGDGSFVAYLKEGVNSSVNHEMGGHGVAQLKDEYIEPGNENLTLPETAKEEMDEMWQRYGIGANVDYHSDVSDVRWAHFLSDERYADEVGIYEGANLYGYGAYRPSENSMMRYNDSPFNAPSRESIYKHVMTYSEDNWTYDYETFVSFDTPIRETLKHQQSNARRAQKADKEKDRRIKSQPPTIYKGTWKSAGQKM